MSQSIELGYPRLNTMASDEQAIAIGRCSYEEFPECGRVWAGRLGARILKEVNGPDERLLIIQIEEAHFWLAFDESSYEISLEPQDPIAGKMIGSLYDQIQLMK
jgi:hypothetical protein